MREILASMSIIGFRKPAHNRTPQNRASTTVSLFRIGDLLNNINTKANAAIATTAAVTRPILDSSSSILLSNNPRHSSPVMQPYFISTDAYRVISTLADAAGKPAKKAVLND